MLRNTIHAGQFIALDKANPLNLQSIATYILHIIHNLNLCLLQENHNLLGRRKALLLISQCNETFFLGKQTLPFLALYNLLRHCLLAPFSLSEITLPLEEIAAPTTAVRQKN